MARLHLLVVAAIFMLLSTYNILPAVYGEVFVGTDRQALLRKGDQGLLPCRVQREVGTVTWSKGLTPQTAQTIIIYRLKNSEWSKVGPGFQSGFYDILENFSLVVHNVTIQDNGDFFCEILDTEIGQNFLNVTNVVVFAPPRSPYPVIEECQQNTEAYANGHHNCSLDVPVSNITCSVYEYFPSISLSFIHKSATLKNLATVEWNNTDGTRNKVVTVTAFASDDPFICVASFGLPGVVEDTDQRSLRVFLTATPVQVTTQRILNATSAAANDNGDMYMTKVVLPIVVVLSVVTLISIIVAVIVCYRVRRQSRQELRSVKLDEFPDEELRLMKEPEIEDRRAKLSGIKAESEALKVHYRETFKETKTSPLDSKSVKKLENIYVNLSLLTGKRHTNQKPLPYEGVIEMLTNPENIARIAFIGEAGVGKTTLVSKIAQEWALGKHLTDIVILLVVPLREIEKGWKIKDVLQMYISRGVELDKDRVEEYMRVNQGKVAFLLDGLDEYVGDISHPDPTDSLIGIMRGDEFKRSPAIVTTRPWKTDQLSSEPTIDVRYTRVSVKGFKKKDIKDYVNKFFSDDPESAKSLIELVSEDSLVFNNMAPYPIFCCMLCNMWTQEDRRDSIKALETFSQLFDEMVYALSEHWLAKSSFRDYRKRCKETLTKVGKIAFEGLLNNKLVFAEHAFEDCKDAMKIACQIGVLSSEKRFAQVENDDQPEKFDILFPHKLFQEYLGGLYLASLYIADRPQFWRLVQGKMMEDYQKFRYLLYFTAAHGNEPGHAGKALIDRICQEISDEEFIVDIAFECHEADAIVATLKYFQANCTHLNLSERCQILDKHTWSGYMHIFHLCGLTLTKTNTELKVNCPSKKHADSSSYMTAIGLFTLQNLRSLEIDGVRLSEYFYRGMATASPYAQIEDLAFRGIQLDQGNQSKYCARSVFQLPKLRTLELNKIKADDKFFSVMSEIGPQSQIEKLNILEIELGSDASRYFAATVFKMERLRTLEFHNMKLDYQFFSVMSDIANDSQITHLTIDNLHFGPTASQLFGNGLWIMDKLHSLTLHSVKLDHVFFSTLAASASKSHIEILYIGEFSINRRIMTSFLALPRLQTFGVRDVKRKDERGRKSDKENEGSEVSSIVVDDKSLPVLGELGLGKLCPQIKELNLEYQRAIKLDFIAMASSAFPKVSHLGIKGPRDYWVTLDNALELCKKIATSYPRLVSLSLIDVGLGNETTEQTVGYLRHQKHLTRLCFTRCNTDKEIDPITVAINQEGGLRLTIQHE